MQRRSALAVILAVSIQTTFVGSQSLPSAWSTGIATNYGGAQDGMNPSSPSFGTLDGSCGYGQLNPDVYPYWSVGALSTSNSFALAGPSNGCGQCFEVQCLNDGGQFAGRCSSAQSVIITITDSCPECESNHLDLQALTFNKIAPMSIGRIDIKYRRVDCTPPLPVSIDIDSNVGAGGWLRLVVERTAGFGGITQVGMRTTGTQSWMAMTNKFGSAWEVSNAPGLPWDFQFTSDSSQTIMAPSLVMQNGQIGNIPTGVQFSLSGSTGSTNISYDSQGPGAGPGPPANPPGGTPAATTAQPPAAPATPPSGGGPPAGGGGGGCCTDVTPAVPGLTITCDQQKAYGKCNEPWMTSGNYCQLTCGHCPASCGGGGGPPATPPGGGGGTAAVPPSAGGAQAASVGLSPTPASPAPGSPAPGSPAPGSPAPGSPTPPAGQSPPAGQGPPASPPASGSPPPSGGGTGTVQTQSVNAAPPSGGSGSSGGGVCNDVSPNGQSCSAIANSTSCSNGSIGAGFCSQSCYRPPCAGRR